MPKTPESPRGRASSKAERNRIRSVADVKAKSVKLGGENKKKNVSSSQSKGGVSLRGNASGAGFPESTLSLQHDSSGNNKSSGPNNREIGATTGQNNTQSSNPGTSPQQADAQVVSANNVASDLGLVDETPLDVMTPFILDKARPGGASVETAHNMAGHAALHHRVSSGSKTIGGPVGSEYSPRRGTNSGQYSAGLELKHLAAEPAGDDDIGMDQVVSKLLKDFPGHTNYPGAAGSPVGGHNIMTKSYSGSAREKSIVANAYGSQLMGGGQYIAQQYASRDETDSETEEPIAASPIDSVDFVDLAMITAVNPPASRTSKVDNEEPKDKVSPEVRSNSQGSLRSRLKQTDKDKDQKGLMSFLSGLGGKHSSLVAKSDMGRGPVTRLQGVSEVHGHRAADEEGVVKGSMTAATEGELVMSGKKVENAEVDGDGEEEQQQKIRHSQGFKVQINSEGVEVAGDPKEAHDANSKTSVFSVGGQAGNQGSTDSSASTSQLGSSTLNLDSVGGRSTRKLTTRLKRTLTMKTEVVHDTSHLDFEHHKFDGFSIRSTKGDFVESVHELEIPDDNAKIVYTSRSFADSAHAWNNMWHRMKARFRLIKYIYSRRRTTFNSNHLGVHLRDVFLVLYAYWTLCWVSFIIGFSNVLYTQDLRVFSCFDSSVQILVDPSKYDQEFTVDRMMSVGRIYGSDMTMEWVFFFLAVPCRLYVSIVDRRINKEWNSRDTVRRRVYRSATFYFDIVSFVIGGLLPYIVIGNLYYEVAEDNIFGIWCHQKGIEHQTSCVVDHNLWKCLFAIRFLRCYRLFQRSNLEDSMRILASGKTKKTSEKDAAPPGSWSKFQNDADVTGGEESSTALSLALAHKGGSGSGRKESSMLAKTAQEEEDLYPCGEVIATLMRHAFVVGVRTLLENPVTAFVMLMCYIFLCAHLSAAIWYYVVFHSIPNNRDISHYYNTKQCLVLIRCFKEFFTYNSDYFMGSEKNVQDQFVVTYLGVEKGLLSDWTSQINGSKDRAAQILADANIGATASGSGSATLAASAATTTMNPTATLDPTTAAAMQGVISSQPDSIAPSVALVVDYIDSLHDRCDECSLLWYTYSWALYSAIVMLTAMNAPPSYNIAEQWFLMIASPSASIVMGLVLARCLSLIRELTLLETTTREKFQLVESAMGKLNLPASVQTRINRYHHFLSVERNSIARDALFEDLSPNLHMELRLILFVKLIETAPFFNDLRTSTVSAVVLGFDEIVVCPGDIIIRKGVAGREMFFILKGQCEVCGSQDGEPVYVVKKPGDYFGEVALLQETLRSAWVRARTFAVLAILTKEKFNFVMEECPKEKQKMLEQIDAQLQAASNKVKAKLRTSKAKDRQISTLVDDEGKKQSWKITFGDDVENPGDDVQKSVGNGGGDDDDASKPVRETPSRD